MTNNLPDNNGILRRVMSRLKGSPEIAQVDTGNLPTNGEIMMKVNDNLYKGQLGAMGMALDKNDFDTLYKPILYGEVSNRPNDKQKLEADVILSTIINRIRERQKLGKNNLISLRGTLTEPNAYQAYNGKQYNAYLSGNLDALNANKRKTIDAIADEQWQRISQGNFNDVTKGAYYYVHKPDGRIIYDNVKPLYK